MKRDPADPGAARSPLRVNGPVTVEEVSAWRDSFVSLLAAESEPRLDLEDSGPWDLAGLQLVLSSIVTAAKAGKQLHCDRVPSGFLAAAEAAGKIELLDRAISRNDE